MYRRSNEPIGERLNSLIGTIYEAALDPSAITGVLGSLRDLTRSDVGAFCIHDHCIPGNCSISHQIVEGVDPWFAMGIRDRQDQNLYFLRRHRVPTGKAVLGEELVARDEWCGVELFEDFLRPAGCVHLLGLAVINDPDLLVEISLYRAERRERYGMDELKIANMLAGHLARAFRMAHFLEETRASSVTFAETLNRLSVGCLVIDSTSRLIFANARAEAFFRRGQPLRLVGGRVAAAFSWDESKWRAMLHRLRAEDREPAGAATLLGNGENACSLIAVPLSPDHCAGLPLARPCSRRLGLVVLADRKRALASAEVLAQLFGLTPSEATLAHALAEGDTLQAYAERCQRSLNTVKTHLKSVFAKTGASRQSELVRLMVELSCIKTEGAVGPS